MKKIMARRTEERIKEIIFKFLNLQEYQLFIFGSRATHQAEEFSDYDIGILGTKPLSLKTLGLIKEALEESDLHVRVDVIDFSLVSPEFKKVALSRIKKL